MKVKQVRSVIDALADLHQRQGVADLAHALRGLSTALKPQDQAEITTAVKSIFACREKSAG